MLEVELRTGATSLASTSTTIELMIRLTEITTRHRFCRRGMIPVMPCSGPFRISTRVPSVRWGTAREDTFAQRFDHLADIDLRQRIRQMIEPNEPHQTRDFDHAQPISQRDVDKNVAGEKWQPDSVTAVFPATDGLVKRQKVFDTSLCEMFSNPLFVSRSGIARVPELS